MPARPRQPAKSTRDAKNNLAQEVLKSGAVASPSIDEGAVEPVPEVRLLGTLQPAASREERIAISAYWRAAKRQFAPGRELEDWLDAEREVDGVDGPVSPRESR